VSTFEERRLARQNWPIRGFALGQEPLVDDRDPSTPLLSGLPFPEYARAQMPGRVHRPT